MKTLKIIFKAPQFLIIFLLFALLFSIEITVTIIASPFNLILYLIEGAIRKLLTYINENEYGTK